MAEKKLEIDIDPTKDLSIENLKGNVVIICGKQSNIECNYEKFGSYEPEIVFKKEDKNKIIIKNSELVRTDALINLPEGINKIEVILHEGNIIIENSKSILELHTTKGSIKIIENHNNVNITNLGGDINIEKLSGFANIKSSEGSIKINSWDRACGSIETDNGQILLKLESVSNSINIKSKYGKIIIGLSKSTDCNIIARGKDVINYLTKFSGDILESPTQIKTGKADKSINIFTANNKVLIAYNNDIERISPDIEKIFQNIDNELEKDIKKLAVKLNQIEDKVVKKGKSFFDRLFGKKDQSKDETKKESEKKSENKRSESNAKMGILNMLKEGKISPEEAEKLLKAIK